MSDTDSPPPSTDDSVEVPPFRVDFGDFGRQAFHELRAEYRSTLSAPPDDMWATFAEQADPAALVRDTELIGCAAVDAAGELHRFFVRRGFEQLGGELFETVRAARPVQSTIVSTLDPGALSVLLPHARSVSTVALLYHHEAPPEGDVLDQFRHATEADQSEAQGFMLASTGMPPAFIKEYAAERIDRRELYLHEIDGAIAGIGERRIDRYSVGFAHLGIVVGPDHRSRGLGAKLMNTLVSISQRDQFTPLCSTEPDNVAARRLIRRAGFRSRHSIFRLALIADAPAPN